MWGALSGAACLCWLHSPFPCMELGLRLCAMHRRSCCPHSTEFQSSQFQTEIHCVSSCTGFAACSHSPLLRCMEVPCACAGKPRQLRAWACPVNRMPS